MSPANSHSFSSNSDVFYISLSCLIAHTGTSNTMLTRRDKSGYPCLIPEFKGKTFSFSLLSMMLAVCFL